MCRAVPPIAGFVQTERHLRPFPTTPPPSSVTPSRPPPLTRGGKRLVHSPTRKKGRSFDRPFYHSRPRRGHLHIVRRTIYHSRLGVNITAATRQYHAAQTRRISLPFSPPTSSVTPPRPPPLEARGGKRLVHSHTRKNGRVSPSVCYNPSAPADTDILHFSLFTLHCPFIPPRGYNNTQAVRRIRPSHRYPYRASRTLPRSSPRPAPRSRPRRRSS